LKNILDEKFTNDALQKNVQNRGAEIIKMKGFSSVNSAAQAICYHLRDWDSDTNGFKVNMAVYVDELFGKKWGVFSSLPIIINQGK
jgi:malate/lactate dehydrogenase